MLMEHLWTLLLLSARVYLTLYQNENVKLKHMLLKGRILEVIAYILVLLLSRLIHDVTPLVATTYTIYSW
jgi:hypothetical protein